MMTIDELQDMINDLQLLDSSQAANYLGLKPATMRNPKNNYLDLSIKIGQYRFWRKEDLGIFATAKLIRKTLDGLVPARNIGYVDGTNGHENMYIDIVIARTDDSDTARNAAITKGDKAKVRLKEIGVNADYHWEDGALIIALVNYADVGETD